MKYLVDSVIFIEHLNGESKATQWLSSNRPEDMVVSIITLAEIFVGVSEDEYDAVRIFLNEFRCLDCTVSTAWLAAKFRREWKWKLPDALQAALAFENKLLLCTKNTKDFSPAKHGFIKIPY